MLQHGSNCNCFACSWLHARLTPPRAAISLRYFPLKRHDGAHDFTRNANATTAEGCLPTARRSLLASVAVFPPAFPPVRDLETSARPLPQILCAGARRDAKVVPTSGRRCAGDDEVVRLRNITTLITRRPDSICPMPFILVVSGEIEQHGEAHKQCHAFSESAEHSQRATSATVPTQNWCIVIDLGARSPHKKNVRVLKFRGSTLPTSDRSRNPQHAAC
jgi:hypothetical protein